MASNLQINQSLLEQAKTLAGLPTKRETVHAALHEFVQTRLRQQLLQLKGKVDFHDDYDHKALRRKRS